MLYLSFIEYAALALSNSYRMVAKRNSKLILSLLNFGGISAML